MLEKSEVGRDRVRPGGEKRARVVVAGAFSPLETLSLRKSIDS